MTRSTLALAAALALAAGAAHAGNKPGHDHDARKAAKAMANADAKAGPRQYIGTAAAPTSAQEREIAGLFDRWNAALRTGNPRTVAALYAPDGVLLPTVSNEVRVGPQAIERYFVDFLKMRPQGTINYREIRMLDDDTALDTGVYTFALAPDGAGKSVQARYTYLYERIGGEWKIVNHHSSAMPEIAAAATAAN